MLPASGPLRYTKKIMKFFIKMVVTDQFKISDRKIMQNEAEYDLDRKAAKISALSSNNLDKYERLTSEGLGLKPSTVEEAKFEYSQLGKVFTKWLDIDDQKEGLFKRLKNIEDKNKVLLKAKNKIESIKEVTDFVDKPLSVEAKELIEEIRVIQKYSDYRKVKINGGNNVNYDFSDYKTFRELFKGLYYKRFAIDEAKREQDEFNAIIGVLEDYTQKNNKCIGAKNKLLNNVKKFYEGREKIIEEFKNEIFPFNYGEAWEEQRRFEREEEERLINIKNENGLNDYRKLNILIVVKIRDVDDELVRDHFLVQDLSEFLEKLQGTKNNPERNKIQLSLINSGLRGLKEVFGDISEPEKETENPNEIVNLVEKFLGLIDHNKGKG